MEPLNRVALELVDEAIDFADELGIESHEHDNGATVLDFGVDAPGGFEAGLLLAEIQTGGLASVDCGLERLAGTPWPHVTLSTDEPGMALLCSQKAGWEIAVEGFEGLGSGPARALVAEEIAFDRVGYRETFDFAVLALEATQLPPPGVAEHVADLAGVEPAHVFLAVAPTGSRSGSTSVAARAAELAVFRLGEMGYDPTLVDEALGTAPIAPPTGEEATAIATTNDALAYASAVYLAVEAPVPEVDELPSSAGPEQGRPFEAIFEAYDWDFYEVPASVFAPAEVTVDVSDGPIQTVGERHEALVAESFGIAGSDA